MIILAPYDRANVDHGGPDLDGGVFAAFGGFIVWRELRRGRRGQALGAAVGIPGTYICGCAALERVGRLYVPGLVLIGASYGAQLLYLRRKRDAPVDQPDTSR